MGKLKTQAESGWDYDISPAFDISFRATRWCVKTARPNQTGDGGWYVEGEVVGEHPVRVTDDTWRALNERHRIVAKLNVTVDEIALAAGVAAEDVKSTLTMAQIESHASTIAKNKVFLAFGVPPLGELSSEEMDEKVSTEDSEDAESDAKEDTQSENKDELREDIGGDDVHGVEGTG
jgi:hypothetical protein